MKRNVKRNGQNDLARSQKVAELLKAGLQGRDLESAIKDVDFEGSSPSADDSSQSASSSPAAAPSPSESLPDVRGWEPSSRDRDASEAGSLVFRSPLLAPAPLPNTVQPQSVTRHMVSLFVYSSSSI